ncbi:MAG: DUF2059 domain-containing protein [Verrucomicrobiota bacterium]
MKTTKVLLVLLALSSSAFAQEPSPKLKLAREVISAMQVDKMLDGMTAQMKQMANQFAPKSDATPEQKQKAEALQEKITDLIISQTREIVSKIDQVYVDVYSDAELNAMKAFFTSPEGKSMTAKQPAVMARMMPLIQDMQRDLQPKMKKLIEEASTGK